MRRLRDRSMCCEATWIVIQRKPERTSLLIGYKYSIGKAGFKVIVEYDRLTGGHFRHGTKLISLYRTSTGYERNLPDSSVVPLLHRLTKYRLVKQGHTP